MTATASEPQGSGQIGILSPEFGLQFLDASKFIAGFLGDEYQFVNLGMQRHVPAMRVSFAHILFNEGQTEPFNQRGPDETMRRSEVLFNGIIMKTRVCFLGFGTGGSRWPTYKR